MARVVVLGAGAMGLAAAYRAVGLGHHVTVLEAGPEPGGMMAHVDLGGLSIERYYHFVCKPDQPTFKLLAELGIADKMRWRNTSMGYFIDGHLYRWGDPISLLTFPELSFLEKLRYGILMFVSAKRARWQSLEHVTARRWIEDWCGRRVYDKLWKPLFEYKFYEYADNISANWIRTRIRRLGRSRRSLMQEQLGYIDGGSKTLVDALTAAIAARGGEIRLTEAATRVLIHDGKVAGVETAAGRYQADAVICTIPTPYVPQLVPDLPLATREAYQKIINIGVICVVLKLRRSISPHFWINVSDPGMPIPGVIEFSNLRQTGTGESVVYVPYYMPSSNSLWNRPDQAFIDEVLACIRRINPQIAAGDIKEWRVSRLKHAQPVCPPDFIKQLPPIQTPIAGLQIADTCFYYPEDRGIAESVKLGRDMADHVSRS